MKTAINRVKRYPKDSPRWKRNFDYYMQVAKVAREQGDTKKAEKFQKKAGKEFLKAGGFEFKL